MMHRTVAPVLALTAAAVALAGPATAAPPPGSTTVAVGGSAPNGVALTGTFRADRFRADAGGGLLVDGTLTGSLTGPGTPPRPVDQPVTLPVDRGASTATRLMLDLAVGPAEQNLAGSEVHVDRSDLHIEVAQGPGSRLAIPMRRFADALPDDAVDNAGLAAALNQIIDLRALRT